MDYFYCNACHYCFTGKRFITNRIVKLQLL